MVNITRLSILAATLRACSASREEIDGVDVNSLLQSRLATRKPSAQFASADALLQTVQNVASSLQNSQMTPEEANVAIGTAQDALTRMEPTFAEQQAVAQREADRQHSEIAACEVSADMAHHDEGVATHHAARLQCEEALAAAAATEAQECEAWTSMAEGLYDGLPDCSRPSSPGELFNVVNNWADFVHGEWASMTAQRSRCQEAREATTDQSQVCASMTDAFVVAFCEKAFACEHTLTGCHEHQVEVYNLLREDIESQVVAWQLQYRTVRQADCILQLIITSLLTATPINDDSLTSCDNVNVDDLVVTFRDAPQAPECPAPENDEPNCASPFGLRHSTWGVFTNVDDLQNGRVAWVDRAYIYQELPEELQGATLFSGPVKQLNSGELTFHTSHRATLYIFSEENRRHGGFAGLGWERVQNAEAFEWRSTVPSCPNCNGAIGCWKREVGAMEDVTIPLTSTWVGGVAAQIMRQGD